MKRVIGILAISALAFLFAGEVVSAKSSKKRWVCWATSISDTSCGTYGWHRDKKIASSSAVELCENECETSCEIDYCEEN